MANCSICGAELIDLFTSVNVCPNDCSAFCGDKIEEHTRIDNVGFAYYPGSRYFMAKGRGDAVLQLSYDQGCEIVDKLHAMLNNNVSHRYENCVIQDGQRKCYLTLIYVPSSDSMDGHTRLTFIVEEPFPRKAFHIFVGKLNILKIIDFFENHIAP